MPVIASEESQPSSADSNEPFCASQPAEPSALAIRSTARMAVLGSASAPPYAAGASSVNSLASAMASTMSPGSWRSASIVSAAARTRGAMAAAAATMSSMGRRA